MFVDFQRGVYDSQAEFVHDLVVLVQHPRLKDLEAFHDVRAKPEVHPGLVVLQLRTCAFKEARQGDFDRNAEVEGQIGLDSEAVKASHPTMRNTPHCVSCEGCVHVAVGQNDHAGLERGQDLVVQAVGEIGRVQQAERQRRQDLRLLPSPGRLLDQLRGVPFSEKDVVPLGLKPFAEQAELRALARTVDALDDDELARIGVGYHERSFGRCGHASNSPGAVAFVNRMARLSP